MPLPTTIALTQPADQSDILASDRRNDNTAVQTAVNGLISYLADSAGLPWLIDIDVFATATTNTNWDTLTVDTACVHNARKESSRAQNDLIGWDLVLAAGTWAVEVTGTTGTTEGIISVQLDDVEKGTIDMYSGATVRNVRQSVTGITVASSGKTRLKLKMATKNASSSNYGGTINHVQLRRTA